MKLGLFTSGYMRCPVEQIFEDANRFGYDYIELWGGFPHAFVGDLKLVGVDRLRSLAEKYQVPISCFTPEHNGYPYNYMIGDEGQWERSMTYLEDAVSITAQLGAGHMLFSAGHAGYEASDGEIFGRLVRSVERLVRKAETENITLILEPLTVYESNVITSARELERALDAVPSKHLVGMVDLAVPFTTGEPAAEYVRRLGDRFGYLHIIDNDGVSDSHILPGDGEIPLGPVLSEIRRAGFDGMAAIELVTGYLKEPSAYAGMAIQRVRELLKE